MKQLNSFKKKILKGTFTDFSSLALELFSFQSEHNPIYKKYLQLLGIDSKRISRLEDIPFLPISFFKHHKVKTLDWDETYVFKSSGTTGVIRSQHFMDDVSFYTNHSAALFEQTFGDISNDIILGLLPSYTVQGNSSLICMVDNLMRKAKGSGYFLNNLDSLEKEIVKGLKNGQRVFLFGVGYALLDFSNSIKYKLDGLTVIETGGMKGRREEMTKDEFYNYLKIHLGNIVICSEYGMTELLSQAYSGENHLFHTPDSMKLMIRDLHDPFSYVGYNKSGGINVIDLANIHSCAFIETQDIGRMQKNGTFEVLGRIDNSDIRGCNLLVD